MRRLLTASICSILCLACMAHDRDRNIKATAIGVDLGSAIRAGELKFSVGHQFSEHWSIEASHGVMLSRLTRGMSDEEKTHYGELLATSTAATDPERNMFSAEIMVKYWMDGTYTGGFITTGCTSGGAEGVDVSIGAGYSMRIWAGIRLSVCYEIGIRESAMMKRPAGKGITFTLSYILT